MCSLIIVLNTAYHREYDDNEKSAIFRNSFSFLVQTTFQANSSM